MKTNALNLSVLVTLVIGCSVLLGSPGLVAIETFRDTGGASFISLGLIGLGFGMCLFQALGNSRSGRRNWFLLACVYSVYLMREADFHNAFSIESLTKLDTYSMLEVPIQIRIVAAMVLLGMTGILIYFIIRYTRTIVNGILSAESWAIALLFWFILLFCSQVFDRSIATSGTHWKLTAIEELLEVSAALFAVLAIGQFAFAQRQT